MRANHTLGIRAGRTHLTRAGAARPQPRCCRRTECRSEATATLSFRYATKQVWVLDLTPSPDPACYDLCSEHAHGLVVPRGWVRVDERVTTVPAPLADGPTRDDAAPDDRPPSGAATLDAAVPSVPVDDRSPVPADDPGPVERGSAGAPAPHAHSRYAQLHAALPRLAAEAATARVEAGGAVDRAAVMSRDLAPIPAEAPRSHDDAVGDDQRRQAQPDGDDRQPPLPVPAGVVVPIERAESRRRLALQS